MTDAGTLAGDAAFDVLLKEIRNCRICVEHPSGKPLPHAPRPVVRARSSAVIAVCGQAPGTRVHASGLPFDDPSGVRLRAWMGVTKDEFYDERTIAFLPMGFCFPGHDANGGDLPPRRECAAQWRERLLAGLPRLQLVLLVGQYAQRWHLARHLGAAWTSSLSVTVGDWRRFVEAGQSPMMVPLPHPSWRNNSWLKANPWFAAELLPELRRHVREARAGI